MKIKTLIAYFIFTCAISSCIQDEALKFVQAMMCNWQISMQILK